MTLALVHGGALASAPPKIVGFGPDLITVLTALPLKDKKSGQLIGAELQGEVTSETVGATNGWRSMRAVIDISCADRRDRVRSMTVFSDHNGQGEARALTPPADWIAAAQNTDYGVAVVNYFCGGAGSRLVRDVAGSKPALPQPTPGKTLLGKTPPVRAESAPEHAETSAPGAAAGPAQENEATTNGMGAVENADALGGLSNKRAMKRAAAPIRPVASGPFAVQVGSAASEAGAHAVFDRLKLPRADLAAGRVLQVESAEVGGQRHFRALVSGFPDAASAARFCDQLKSANGCIVRRAP